MCGICGYINFSKKGQDSSVLSNMVNTLHHRGPDSQGYFEDLEHQVFLGHARLSIIDISDNGKQPMSFGNLTIVFNGEIYNYREIKKELSALGHSFNTSSDTEVILHSYKEWGTDCVCRFIGMFAFAIYDSDKQTVAIFRDRAGVKPLYYYFDQQVFIFGSELKAFHQNPLFKKELEYNALQLYIRYGYIPTPYCVFKNTHKLTQGSYLKVDLVKKEYDITRYWDLKQFYLKPKLDISYEEALEQTEQILTSAFKYRMVSDVPVGVFLSAGFDSTCVAALLQSNMTDKLRTFTIGFETGNNEAPMAKQIAAYLGTDHTEHYCSEADAIDIIKDLPYYYDEPFADNSAIPTILVSKMARQHVKVALSADGGDEIFAGYTSYASYMKGLKMINNVPEILRKPLGHVASHIKGLISEPMSQRRVVIFSDVLMTDRNTSSYLSESIQNHIFTKYDGDYLTKSVTELSTVYNEPNEEMTLLSRLLFADYIQYMQDDVLVKVDRATMSTSLEGRNPLLDHRIVEFAAQLSDDFKFSNGIKKRILKDIVYKHVPKDLVDKPKTGFGAPISRWLHDGLNSYVEHYLATDVVRKYGVLSDAFVEKAKVEYNKYPDATATNLWRILQLQMWLEHWMN